MKILLTPAPQGIVILIMVVAKLWVYSRDLGFDRCSSL